MSEGTRIAVIEDDPQMLRFLKTGLEANGYAALEAAPAARAWRRWSPASPK